MRSKVAISIVLAIFILTISFPRITAAAATQPENNWFAQPLINVSPAVSSSPRGLSPTQIKAAYNLPSTGGTGVIAIVDAYDCPTVNNDLIVFSNQFGLPAPNFEKHKMASTISVNSGWALEISLDVQWAHAIAPNAKILLVEARSNSFSDLLAAVNYARSRSDVVAISMSWGGNEFSTETLYDYYFTSAAGVSFFASSGDGGAGVIWPSCSPKVVAVGGTTLSFNPSGTLASETAWSGSGGGISAYEAEPSYQLAYGISNTNGKRAVPDVSYDADPYSGVSVYDTTPYVGQTGWFQVGGTSAGAPQWAAIHSLGLSSLNDNFYQDAKTSYNSYFRDITAGSNGAYSATKGYDLVTGLGSPITVNFNQSATPDFSISASPSSLTIPPGGSGIATVTISSLNGFSGTVSLSATPFGWANPNPASINGAGTSTLTVTVPSGTVAGANLVTVTGTSGTLSHSTTITVNVPTAPSAPQYLKADSSDTRVALSWSAPSSDGGVQVTNYNVYRGPSQGAEILLATMGNMLSYTDTAVTNGKTYYYYVTAVNSVGESGPSNEASATPSASSVKALSVAVQTDKTTYLRGSIVAVTVTVTDGTNAVQRATVQITIYNALGTPVWQSSSRTDATGIVRLYYRLDSTAQRGIYRIVVAASVAGYQGATKQITFNVT